MRTLLKASFLILFTALFTESAFARPHRCNGRVYQQPCSQVSLQNTYLGGPRAQLNPRIIRIENSTFKKLDSSTGHWHGYLSGSGSAKLILELFSNGSSIAKKYLGTIHLDPSDGPTFFSYKTTLPKISPWDWKLTAVAR